jgi:hypothetical protein
MTMTRRTGPCLRLLLAAAVVLVTASCGSGGPGTSAAPGGAAASAAPGASGTPALPATPGPATPGATGTRSPGATAVISGVVAASPTCPADPVYHACRPRPLPDVEVQARSPGAALIASVRTGADGRYSLRLGPGSYLLVVVTTQVLPKCPPVPVSVRSGSAAAIRADINCDTGMRPVSGPAA